MPISLPMYRDLLLPSLWGRGDNLDLICDFENDAMLITDGKRTEPILTRRDFEDGTFKGKFNPAVITFLAGPSS